VADLQALGVRLLGEHQRCLLDRVAQVEVGRVELEVSGLHLGEVEHVADHPSSASLDAPSALT
jgi:hypothetical protein